MAFFAAGVFLWNVRHTGPSGDPLSRYAAAHPRQILTIEGRVRRADLLTPGSTYTTLVMDVDRAAVGNEEFPMHGGVHVRWRNPGAPVFADERVRVRATLKTRLGPVNPSIQGVEDYLRRHKVHSAVSIRGPDAVARVAPAPWWSPKHWASRLRAAQAKRLIKTVPESALPFVMTVWLGDRSRISQEEYQAYLDSGTAHILAVSGVHLGIVFISLKFLLGLLTRKRRLRAIIVMGAVLFFALMAGGRVSALRAALMINIYLLADLFDREPDTPTALSIAAILFALINPNVLFDHGFQLSFASVASILVFADPISRCLGRLPFLLREGVSTTLAVQIIPLPLALHLFHVLPAAAPIANLLVVPLLTISLWICFMTAIAGFAHPALALLFGHALGPIVSLIHGVVHGLSALPATHWPLMSPARLALVLYGTAAGFLWVALSADRRRRLWFACATVLVTLTILCWRPFHPKAEVVFLDVGHGDATFIRTPGGSTVLIDTGDNNVYVDMGRRVVAPFLWSKHVSHVDYVVVSHPDRDHIGGVFFLLERFSVGEVILGPIETDRPLERDLIERCAERAVPVGRVSQGETIPLAGASLEFLHPPADGSRGESINNQSLVLRLVWPDAAVLLPGDIEARAEKMLITRDTKATVLKAPHHGSDTSNTRDFIESVQPGYCVISTGGHTGREGVSREVVDRYNTLGVAVWRTDIDGGVTLRTDKGGTVLTGERGTRGYVRSGF